MGHQRKPGTATAGNIFVICVALLVLSLASPVRAYIQSTIDAAASGDTINIAAGTYNESITINKSLSIIGAGSATTAITGGVVIAGEFDGLTIEGISLSGDGPGPKNSVIDSRPTTGPVSNITIRDCVIDGEGTGKYAFYGHYISGTWTITGCEIKNIASWYVIDNTGSNHEVPYQLEHVVFTNNHVHHVGGTITFRGKFEEPMQSALISGNVMEDLCGSSCGGWIWAGVEVNNCNVLTVTDNVIKEAYSEGNGNGHALQLWSMSPWVIDIHDNEFTDSAGGIWILTHATNAAAIGAALDPPQYFQVPTGSLRNNDFSRNTMFGLAVNDSNGGGPMDGNALFADISAAGAVDAESNYWGDASGAGGAGPGSGSAVTSNIDSDPWWTDAAMTTADSVPVIQFALRSPASAGPDEPIKLYLDVTSNLANIASVGTRITYNANEVDFDSFALGSDVPSTWSAVFSETGTAGEVDLVITDVSLAAATVASPVTGIEAISLTFTKIGSDCDGADFAFNSAASANTNAFPATHYVHSLDAGTASVVLHAATETSGVSSPAVDDHSFIRGNLNNRSAHTLDISDVLDLAAYLYSGLVLNYDCQAAIDVNNDGSFNITDLVTQVQGIFNSSLITIPPPNFSNPGLGIAGVGASDGGSIPSVLGCADGESCP